MVAADSAQEQQFDSRGADYQCPVAALRQNVGAAM